MPGTDADAEVRVEVWTRDPSPPPDDPRRAVLARLRDLEAAGRVADVSVRVWSKYVATPDDAPDGNDPPVRERIAEFRRWAERNGHSLEPAFRRFERSTVVSDDAVELLRLPLQCLAVYEGDRLVGVFPCSTESGTETVTDCLRRLESETLGESGEE